MQNQLKQPPKLSIREIKETILRRARERQTKIERGEHDVPLHYTPLPLAKLFDLLGQLEYRETSEVFGAVMIRQLVVSYVSGNDFLSLTRLPRPARINSPCFPTVFEQQAGFVLGFPVSNHETLGFLGN